MKNEERVKHVMQKVLERLSEQDETLTVSAAADRNYIVTVEDIVRDIWIFSDEVFDGETEAGQNFVKVRFRNGQNYKIVIEEVFD